MRVPVSVGVRERLGVEVPSSGAVAVADNRYPEHRRQRGALLPVDPRPPLAAVRGQNRPG